MNINRGYCSLRTARENSQSFRGACASRPGNDGGVRPPRETGSLAMVYSPKQSFSDIIPPGEALKAGTIFKSLVLPFYGERGMKGACL